MTAGQKPDEWLMCQVSWGRREHLEPLVRRYASPLLTFIARMIGHPQRSEEIFQEVFLLVWEKRRQYDASRPFKPWLYRIALNRCRSEFRYPYREPFAPLDEEPIEVVAATPSPVDVVIATETASIVAHAVEQLPVKQRAVVVLRVWGGLSYGEIAEAVGSSEGTVRSNMHHGLAAMRAYLEPRLR
jgi:RNA polymerase sigma-70 factor (ECF subfamily)